jgi:hypothetical protein
MIRSKVRSAPFAKETVASSFPSAMAVTWSPVTSSVCPSRRSMSSRLSSPRKISISAVGPSPGPLASNYANVPPRVDELGAFLAGAILQGGVLEPHAAHDLAGGAADVDVLSA